MGEPKAIHFPKEEPSADMRMAAHHVRQLFVALIQEGFREAQAIAIIGQVLRNEAR